MRNDVRTRYPVLMQRQLRQVVALRFQHATVEIPR